MTALCEATADARQSGARRIRSRTALARITVACSQQPVACRDTNAADEPRFARARRGPGLAEHRRHDLHTLADRIELRRLWAAGERRRIVARPHARAHERCLLRSR